MADLSNVDTMKQLALASSVLTGLGICLFIPALVQKFRQQLTTNWRYALMLGAFLISVGNILIPSMQLVSGAAEFQASGAIQLASILCIGAGYYFIF